MFGGHFLHGLAGHPQINIPGAMVNGLPVGLSLIAARGADTLLVRTALHLADPALLQMETALDLAFKKQQLAAGLGDPQQANQLREQIMALEREASQPQIQPVGPIVFRLAIGSIGGFLLAAGVAALVRSGGKESVT